MTDPLFLLVYIFLFPGFAFLILYAWALSFLDRKIAARMQQRVGPPSTSRLPISSRCSQKR